MFKILYMKKIQKLTAAFIVSIMVASCSKDAVLEDLSITEVSSSIEGKTWKISYYFEAGDDDHADDFAGYTFLFDTGGALVASNGTLSFTGTWLIKKSDDSKDYDKEIDITIIGNELMDEIDGSWQITELSDTTLKLQDDNGDEEMHFEKL